MRNQGQTTFESTLIVTTGLTIVMLGLAGFKAALPQEWLAVSSAYSDVLRDYSWKTGDYVTSWTSGEAVRNAKAAMSDWTPPAPGGPSRLRPAADPLKDIRALR